MLRLRPLPLIRTLLTRTFRGQRPWYQRALTLGAETLPPPKLTERDKEQYRRFVSHIFYFEAKLNFAKQIVKHCNVLYQFAARYGEAITRLRLLISSDGRRIPKLEYHPMFNLLPAKFMR